MPILRRDNQVLTKTGFLQVCVKQRLGAVTQDEVPSNDSIFPRKKFGRPRERKRKDIRGKENN